jgi:hypothetical protein
MPLRTIEPREPTVQFALDTPDSWIGGARFLCYEHVSRKYGWQKVMLETVDVRGGGGIRECNMESEHGMGCPMWRKDRPCSIVRPGRSGIYVDDVFHKTIPAISTVDVRVVPVALGGDITVVVLNYGAGTHTLVRNDRCVTFSFPVDPAFAVFFFESPRGDGLCCVGTLHRKERQGLFHLDPDANTWHELVSPPEELVMGPCSAYEQAMLFYSEAGSVWCLRPTMVWERTDLNALPLNQFLAVDRLGHIFEWSPYTCTLGHVESRRCCVETYLALRELDMPKEMIGVVLGKCRWPKFN